MDRNKKAVSTGKGLRRLTFRYDRSRYISLSMLAVSYLKGFYVSLI